jgi:hypothetical protein
MSSTSGTRATPSSSRTNNSHEEDDIDMEPQSNVIPGTAVAKPEFWEGDRRKLEDWLIKWDLYFMFQGSRIPEEKKVTLVASYMRGRAFTWIKPFLRRYHDAGDSTDVDPWFEDFDLFKEQLRPIFGVSNEPTIARRDIQRIRQEKSAADYAAEFQQLATYTGWNDNALMTMFRQGLKPKVKEELMRTAASVDTFDTLVNEAINIDVRLQELQQELRDDPRARVVTVDRRPPPRQPWRNNLSNRGNRYQPNMGRHRVHNNTQSGYYGPEAMDLSNLIKGPERWNQKKGTGSQQDKSKVVCYNCNKPGHYARDCRMKNKVIRQINVLTQEGLEDGEEWDILTEDMGCLLEDTESEHDDTHDHISNEDRFDRAPTPHQEFFEPVATRSERQGRRKRQTKMARNGVGHWVEQALQDSIDAGTIIRTRLPAYQDSATQTKENEPVMVMSPQPRYDLDLRNMKHGLRSWTACHYDHCPVHYEDKKNSGWFPTLKGACKLLWYECTKDMCEVHLWDKRSKLHFPGTDDPQRIIQMQLVVNGGCYNVHWQHCLNKDCDLHRGSKHNNGFGEEEPFLGLRLRAPGIDPSIPWGSTNEVKSQY